MNRPTIILLLSLAVGILIIVSSTFHQNATAVSNPARPDLPEGTFAARIYYDQPEDINKLTVHDLWEYNNLQDKYLLLSLDSTQYLALESQGWRLAVDDIHTANLTTNSAPFSSGYRTVEEIYAQLTLTNQQYPQITELVTYGKSTCLAQGGCITTGGETFPGHNLQAMRISNETIPGTSTITGTTITRGKKPIFFLLANIHAREIVTPEIALRLINHLLNNYGSDADSTWLIDHHELWIVPTANPDGHWLVELGDKAPYSQGAFYQRKNANMDADDNGSLDCYMWPPSVSWQYGVDLNRNHSFSWGGAGSSTEPCAQTFRGPKPASEMETIAIQNLVTTLIPDQRGEDLNEAAPQSTTGLLLTLHSFGDYILWPWGSIESPSPNYDDLKAIGDKLATYNGYQSCQASTCLYLASGTTDDWAYGELGIPAFTYEIGRLFMPDYDDIDSTLWPENIPSLLYAARIARTPYETIQGPDVVEITSKTISKNELLLTAAVDDSHHGGQNITTAAYSINLPHWMEGSELRTLSPVDGAFDDKIETVTAVIPINDLNSGNNILYLRGQDSDGRWGVVSSIFITTGADQLLNTYFPITISSY